jgi:hypothetical protein
MHGTRAEMFRLFHTYNQSETSNEEGYGRDEAAIELLRKDTVLQHLFRE